MKEAVCNGMDLVLLTKGCTASYNLLQHKLSFAQYTCVSVSMHIEDFLSVANIISANITFDFSSI